MNRREEILEAAGELFVEHGYAGTSTQQIADAVGCTKAALYYHFNAGKEELYNEVIKTRGPDLSVLLENCDGSESLKALILCFARNMARHTPELMDRMRWVTSEFPNFEETMRTMICDQQLVLLHDFSELVAPFVKEHEEAVRIATLTVSAMVGYEHSFVHMGTEAKLGIDREGYMEFLAALIAARY